LTHVPRSYLEDLEEGSAFGGETYQVDADEMLAFSRKWDPRDIHVDDDAGQAAGYGGLIASGAYTTAIFTLLSLRAREKDGDHAVLAGLGAEIALSRPVRSGDTLRYAAKIVEVRESKNRPDAGVVKTEASLVNQKGETVYQLTTATLVAKRPRPES
jgi:acyl dehydratase